MNVESTVQKICNCLDALLCETKTEPDSNVKISSDKEALVHELKRKVHITLEKIENYPEIKGIVIKFVQTCYGKKCCCDHLTFLQMSLVLLRLLQKALSQEETDSCSSKSHGGCKMFMPRGLLSISQQEVLKKCFQFIVGLGVLPNLLRGVGVPLSRRLQHSNVFENFISDSTSYQKHVQLVLCLETLLDCLECEAMHNILFTNHGTDVFATLLQLCHSPIKKIDQSQMPTTKTPMSEKIEFRSVLAAIRDNSNHTESEVVSLMLMHRNHFNHRLEKFLNQIKPPLLMWELILFQGIKPRNAVSDILLSRRPGWMRKVCNQMLTDLIMQSHGIVSLIQAVLENAFNSDLESGKIDVMQMVAMSQLITSQYVRSLENYMQRLSKQVFQLLHTKDSAMDCLLKCVASCIVLKFHELNGILAENCFFKKILEPLWKCVLTYDNKPANEVVVSEKEITTCIEELYQIFISVTLQERIKAMKVLFPLFHCLSMLYFFLVEGTSFLKSKVKELLIFILNAASTEEALGLLYVVTIPNCQHLDVHQTTVSFANGDEGGVVAKARRRKPDIAEEIRNYRPLLDLINDLRNKELNSSFILLIMKEYCSFHLEVKDSSHNACNVRVRIAFSALLQELSEWNADVGEALISNIAEVIELLMTLLESICNYRNDAPFYEETAMVVLMILSSLLTSETHELSSEDWLCVKKCLPSLYKLQKCDIDSDLKEMLFSVLVHIATHGSACITDTDEIKEFLKNHTELGIHNPDSSNDEDSEDDSSTESVSMELLRESFIRASKANNCEEVENSEPMQSPNSFPQENELPKSFTGLSVNSNPGNNSEELCNKTVTSYQAALLDAMSEEIPIRGHGLLVLGRLIQTRDEVALKNKITILELFQEHLKDEDSYVYLPAIQGLSYLVEVDPETSMPAILSVYENAEENSEILLKMGEVLLKVCILLGERIYKYRDQMLHSYLIGTKHPDPQVRSSCLSNIGQACLYLKFNISGHWLQEILVCVLSYLKTDRDLEVRRCAVMVLGLLVTGLGKDMLGVLENDIHSIYTQLKLILNTEQDEVMIEHSKNALKEINSIMNGVFLPNEQQQFKKEIRILP